ncbi:MAG: GNVR domain-containing protein, partial [candidate division KSB1 bacterium]
DLLKGSDEAMTYMAILKSRTVREAVIRKYDLINVYEEDDVEKTLKAFDENLDLTLEREGTITISVLDQSPERSAAMANSFAEFLDSVNVELSIQKARNNRIFIEKRFSQNKDDMRRAEDEMRAFQEKHGAIALPVQTEAAIKGAAALMAEIAATEVELGVKQKSLTPTHIQVIETKNKLFELDKKLNEMKYGSPAAHGATKSDQIFIPFTAVPEIGLEFARRFREVEVQKTLYQFLIQQYEQAKLQEAKDVPTIQILDRAVPPLHKIKPKRMLIVALASISATMILATFLLIAERLRLLQEEEPEKYRRWAPAFGSARTRASHE